MAVAAVPLGGLRRMVDLVLPNRCVGCRVVIGRDGALCPACFARLDFITAPLCVRCGLPLPGSVAELGEDASCPACVAHPPRVMAARAALVYGGLARDIVLMLKHADRTDLARPLAQWLLRAGGPLVERAQLVVPVPLHAARLARRRYNQAGLLARALATASATPLAIDLLRRVRSTPSQGHLTARQRQENVRNAFAVRPRALPRLQGARVLLIDDVMTTGATLEACAAALLKGGAAAVDALVVARVVRTDPALETVATTHI